MFIDLFLVSVSHLLVFLVGFVILLIHKCCSQLTKDNDNWFFKCTCRMRKKKPITLHMELLTTVKHTSKICSRSSVRFGLVFYFGSNYYTHTHTIINNRQKSIVHVQILLVNCHWDFRLMQSVVRRTCLYFDRTFEQFKSIQTISQQFFFFKWLVITNKMNYSNESFGTKCIFADKQSCRTLSN